MSKMALPNEWVDATLNDIADRIVGGGTPSKSIPAYFMGEIPWMTVKDMNKHTLTDTVDHISQEAVDNSSTNIIPAGIPIVATRMSLGKIVVASFDSAINQDLKAIFINRHVASDYFIYWYRSLGTLIESLGTGTTVKGIRLEVLRGLALPLSPFAEQQEIAARLDIMLAQVDTIKGRLDALPAILKRFRQSVLAAAVSGKLTEEWHRENNILGPSEKPLKEVISSLDQGWSPKCINEPAEAGEWAVIKTSAVQNIKFEREENKILPADLNARPHLSLRKNDILITRAGPRVRCGVTCIVESDYPNLMICDKVYRIRVNYDEVLPIYLTLLLNSPQYLDDIEKLKTGTSDSGMNLTQKKFYDLRALFPVVKEQTEIVRRVEQLFSFADKIEQRVNDAQARVNHLTQSILAKAFRGELTADWRQQNPELISGENSAEALLARIQAERAAQAPAKRGRKKAG